MPDNQVNRTDFKNPYTVKEFKSCSGKFCNNQGINLLKIIYINKTGWFCDKCKTDLTDLDLVARIEKLQEEKDPNAQSE